MNTKNKQPEQPEQTEVKPIKSGGFQESTSVIEITDPSVATAIAREEGEIKAAIYLAQTNPRNEAECFDKIIASCRRPFLAEGAMYSFERGGKKISGPSVKLAREMARCWRNIRYGIRIIHISEDYVHIEGHAMDMETGVKVSTEDSFEKLIQRNFYPNGKKVSKWVKPDERDLRELISRRGALCVRNSILQTLPPDITEQAKLESKKTMVAAARGELKQNREDTLRSIAVAFRDFAVTIEMLEQYLEYPLDRIDDNGLAELRAIFNSLRDGNTKRADHFQVKEQPPSQYNNPNRIQSLKPDPPDDEQDEQDDGQSITDADVEAAPGNPRASPTKTP